MNEPISLDPIAVIRSPLRDRASAPRQGDEGAPEAWLEIREPYATAARNLAPDDEIIVLTWLHEADRDVLEVHPRDDERNPLTGVFSTRSSDRPNPIGLHRVRILEVKGLEIRVSGLEAIDGTPVVDVKPALGMRER